MLVDKNADRAAQVRRGESYVEDVPSEGLEPLVREGIVTATPDYDAVVEPAPLVVDFLNATGRNGRLNGKVWKL